MTVSSELAQHPLVLLPGFMSDGRIWEPQIRVLSRYIPVTVAPLWAGERVEDVAAYLLEHLPPRFSVVGMGLGGSVAMEILHQASNRVAGIGMICASPLAETPAMAAQREPRIIRARAGRVREVMQEVCNTAGLAPGPERARIIQEMSNMAEELGPDLLVAQSRMMQRRGDQQATLRRASQPALVICGEHDQQVPIKRQIFMAELMQNARLEVLPDAGHQPLMEQPERVTSILCDWILRPQVSELRQTG